MGGRWFEERREILLRELVAGYVETWADFMAFYRRFCLEGKVPYEEWERWIGTENRRGPLWRLKDLSHSIIRREGYRPTMHEILLDWTVGAIFHECQKIREEIFQLSHPLEVDDRENLAELPEIREVLEEWEGRMARIRVSLREGFKEVHRLFHGAWKGMKGFLILHREMGLLMRYLAESRSTLISLVGEEEWGRFMEVLYPRGEADLWYRAGLSYLRGGWVDRAREAFHATLRLCPEHSEARRRLKDLEKDTGAAE